MEEPEKKGRRKVEVFHAMGYTIQDTGSLSANLSKVEREREEVSEQSAEDDQLE